jgi:hypothetical protein
MKFRLLSVFLLIALLATVGTASAANSNFVAHLAGGAEVPPVETLAQGQAIFQLSKDGSELHYKLIAANIENVFMAHIHMAAADETGPIVVWLYPPRPPAQLIGGRFDGVLAEGTITAEDLTGPLAGMNLSDLVAQMQAGNTYVNVHTNQHTSGEVRGQIH